jgi:hypothetical protein
MNWAADHLTEIIAVLSATGIAGGMARQRINPLRVALGVLTWFLDLLDCQIDRLRWEQTDKRRNRELESLRVEVDQLQDRIAAILAQQAASSPDSSRSSATPDAASAPPARIR